MAVRHYTIKVTVYEEGTSVPNQITAEELGEIAKKLSAEEMSNIAKSYLNIKVDSENVGNEWKFNFELLQSWLSSYRGTEARQTLTTAFSKAAREGIVDYDKIPATFQGDEIPELSDSHLQELSQRITSEQELRELGQTGLNLKEHKIDAHIANNKNDITIAAHRVLKVWLKTQADRKIAYINLSKALKEANMKIFIKDVLKRK